MKGAYVLSLGFVPYREAWELQRALAGAVSQGAIPDTVILLEHEAVAEAAVVPAPDELRLAVPKAYVVLAEGWEPGPDSAKVLFDHSREVLAPYKRIRRLEFAPLPKTVSGKIRRIELREATAAGSDAEYREEDFR